MRVVNKLYVETRIFELNLWLEIHSKHHVLRAQKEQELQYYAQVAQQMDESKTDSINLNQFSNVG